jgi:NADH-quinone oxidoreductase subunit G
MFQKLFRELFNSNNLDYRLGVPGEPAPDDIGAALGVGKGTNLFDLGKGTTVLVLGADPEEEAPLYVLRLRRILSQGGQLVVANNRTTKLDHSATSRLRYRPGSDMQVAHALLRAMLDETNMQQDPRGASDLHELREALNHTSVGEAASNAGLSEDDIRNVARSLLHAENSIILYGADALAVGPALPHALGSMLLLTGRAGTPNNGLIPLLSSGNSRGVLDMGVRADQGPGYQPLGEPGLSAREMWGAAIEKRLRGMYIMELDPAASPANLRPALEALDFLVVQDMFLTETAQLADVVLPASAFAERDGTYTNVERRVQRSRKARQPHGESRDNWLIVAGVAQEVLRLREPVAARKVNGTEARAQQQVGGATQVVEETDTMIGWDYVTAAEVGAEIAECVPGYQGITHTALKKTGRRGTWGRQTNEAIYYDGTNYENTEGVGLQWPARVEDPQASVSLKPLPDTAPAHDEQYPYTLLVQSLLYDGDPLLIDSRLLKHVPDAYVGLSRADAQKLDIRKGMRVRVSSSAGALELPARPMRELEEGSVLIPANLPGAPLATLQTGPRTRVAISKIEGEG